MLINKSINKYDLIYLKIAIEWSKLSYCVKKKVGVIIVKNNTIISNGYNETPRGFEKKCEDKHGKTKWYVLHAEANAILKVSTSTQSCEGSFLYSTLSPCKECSKLIHQAKIKKVIYIQEHDQNGLSFLEKSGIKTIKYLF